jgi:hypothetical protein
LRLLSVKGGKTMMNIFTNHTQEQGVTYLEHLYFAHGIAIRLFNSVFAFVMHGLFPFINIKKELDLEAIAKFILERNDWIESQKPKERSEELGGPVLQTR